MSPRSSPPPGACARPTRAPAPPRPRTRSFRRPPSRARRSSPPSGDNGSNDCRDHSQSVDDPSSQPWVTGVGASTIHPPAESVWDNSYGATGGGVSNLWARPAYQTAAAQAQTPISCGAAGTSCREVPDVTADGDPNTGYVIYYNGQWNTMGGTRISTPTWAAIAALADASPACAGHPVGFVNPALYQLAATAYAANFGDVTSGSNGYGGVAGLLRRPRLRHGLRSGNPQRRLAGSRAVRRFADAHRAGRPEHRGRRCPASDRERHELLRAAISYTAAGLPPGLTIAPRRARSPVRRPRPAATRSP